MKRILFINAINYKDHNQAYLPPLGLGYLVSSLRNHFGPDYFEFKIIDRTVEEVIKNWRPVVVGITSVSENWNIAKSYAATAKQYGATVLVGGMHVSALPETMTRDMDLAVIGEGERTIVELFKAFNSRAPFGGIPGIAFWQDDVVVSNPARPVIKHLDSIPLPDRSSFPARDTRYMFTARGCPYRCTFCASSRYWSDLRYFSPEYVIECVRQLVENHGAKHIEIWDDLFISNYKRFERIVELLEFTGLSRQVSFTCQVRANLIDDDTAELLKRMNMSSVWMGLESGSEKTLEYLKGHSVTVADNLQAINILNKHGLNPIGSFIIGCPGETRADIEETYQFIKASGLSYFQVHLLVPLPGTPVWDYAVGRGIVSADMDFSRLGMAQSGMADPVIVSDTLTYAELSEIYQRFMRLKTRMQINRVLRNPLIGMRRPGELIKMAGKIVTGQKLYNQ